ncbi:hypothetical protein BABINDRAFT_109817 [Babjeviella inositovora NRRL Y-12698]|uniref:Uncharacterized protein n=1 Tax=Babjeviella inositovora NRRL Y-12698 TaxID=984486 RepID=A0A1E3QX48_9ASCO|nr:uncharacterized protein BABINDRAFT_109817 [Babjeviella inositovora NRRL Y-12698]ODQ81652.1 hypothetical protein BABINDRAFT_109817 [Babjeviella inositovora NRRL Y-12698]
MRIVKSLIVKSMSSIKLKGLARSFYILLLIILQLEALINAFKSKVRILKRVIRRKKADHIIIQS